jgi:hypothetical protein
MVLGTHTLRGVGAFSFCALRMRYTRVGGCTTRLAAHRLGNSQDSPFTAKTVHYWIHTMHSVPVGDRLSQRRYHMFYIVHIAVALVMASAITLIVGLDAHMECFTDSCVGCIDDCLESADE